MIHYNLLSLQLNYFIISPTYPNRIQLFKSSPNENILQRHWFNTDPPKCGLFLSGIEREWHSRQRAFANIVHSPLVLLWTSGSEFHEKETEYWKLDFLRKIKWQNQVPHLPSTVLVEPMMQVMIFSIWTYHVFGLCSESQTALNKNPRTWRTEPSHLLATQVL